LGVYLPHFKGLTFDFDVPGYDLVITTYDDQYTLDAELMAIGNAWYPSRQAVSAGQFGEGFWHTLALGILGENDAEMAFSEGKSAELEAEWIDYISGPSLVGGGETKGMVEYLDDVLNPANANYGFIPFKNILGDYITQAEALDRYTNLKNFYTTYGHLWVGDGPLVLSGVDTAGKKLELDAFQDYQEDGSQWFFLLDPEPVSPPAHNGAWVDKVTVEIQDHLPAINMLQSDQLDVYAAGLADPDIYDTVIADPDLYLFMSYGLFDELTLNPSGPFFPGSGKLNPFALPAVREALNWAIDRSHIKNEIYGGFASERYTCVATISADYLFRYPALLEATEDEYRYDFEKADAAIEAAMLTIPGVTREGDGKYYYTAPAA